MSLDEHMSMAPHTKPAKEIEKALRMKALFGSACLDDPELSRLLLDLRDLIHKTDSVMLQSGAASACAVCAAVKGSCCFREMGESFGSVELFVNLLLGSVLPEETDFPGSCHFVGKKGCRLMARQSFCLNYFCPELRESLGEETVRSIQRHAGEQLLAFAELERTLTTRLGNQLSFQVLTSKSGSPHHDRPAGVTAAARREKHSDIVSRKPFH